MPTDTDTISGNRILNMEILERTLEHYLQKHSEQSDKCMKPAPSWPSCKEDQNVGLGFKGTIVCKHCNFAIGPVKYYTDELCDTIKRGPKVCSLNKQLSLFSFKSAVPYDDIELLFGMLGLKSGSKSNFFEKKHTVAPIIGGLAVSAMNQNMSDTKEILALNPDMKLACTIDTNYNNPHKGRGYSSPGTQSCTTLFEAVTPAQMLLDTQPLSQQCSRIQAGFACDHSKNDCGLNYSPLKTIDSTEKYAAGKSFEACHAADLKISELIHDGMETSKHQAGMNEAALTLECTCPDSKICLAHVSRNTAAQFYKCELSAQALCNMPRENVNKFRTSAGHSISKRLTLEEIGAKEKSRNENEFVNLCLRAGCTVVPCLAGDHSLCKVFSYVCNGEATDKIPSHLPYGQYLNLTDHDKNEIYRKMVQYRFTERRLHMQYPMMTTNRAESYNRSVLSYSPKHKNYSRFYKERCLSAAHTDAKGFLEAMLEFMHHAGVPIPLRSKAYKSLAKIHKRKQYDRSRARSVKSKQQRKDNIYKKAWMRKGRRLMIVDGAAPTMDHQEYTKH